MTKAEKIKERHQLAIRDYPEQEYERAIDSIESAADRRQSWKSFIDLLPETIVRLSNDGFYIVEGMERSLGERIHVCWEKDVAEKLQKKVEEHARRMEELKRDYVQFNEKKTAE